MHYYKILMAVDRLKNVVQILYDHILAGIRDAYTNSFVLFLVASDGKTTRLCVRFNATAASSTNREES